MKKLQETSSRSASDVVESAGVSPSNDATKVAQAVAVQLIAQYNEAGVVVNRIREWHREYSLCGKCPDDKQYNELTGQRSCEAGCRVSAASCYDKSIICWRHRTTRSSRRQCETRTTTNECSNRTRLAWYVNDGIFHFWFFNLVQKLK